MGGGTKYGEDVPKSYPRDPLAAIFEFGGSQEQQVAKAHSFCEQPGLVPFKAFESATPIVGSEAHLVIGEPPTVIAGNQSIGYVEGPIAKAMRGCLEIGYWFSGSVTSFDEQTRVGMIDVQGERRAVA